MRYDIDMQDCAVLLEYYRMKVLAYSRMTHMNKVQEQAATRCLHNVTALIDLAKQNGWTWLLEDDLEAA